MQLSQLKTLCLNAKVAKMDMPFVKHHFVNKKLFVALIECI